MGYDLHMKVKFNNFVVPCYHVTNDNFKVTSGVLTDGYYLSYHGRVILKIVNNLSIGCAITRTDRVSLTNITTGQQVVIEVLDPFFETGDYKQIFGFDGSNILPIDHNSHKCIKHTSLPIDILSPSLEEVEKMWYAPYLERDVRLDLERL